MHRAWAWDPAEAKPSSTQGPMLLLGTLRDPTLHMQSSVSIRNVVSNGSLGGGYKIFLGLNLKREKHSLMMFPGNGHTLAI